MVIKGFCSPPFCLGTVEFEFVIGPQIFQKSIERLVAFSCLHRVHAFWLPEWEGAGGGGGDLSTCVRLVLVRRPQEVQPVHCPRFACRLLGESRRGPDIPVRDQP